MNKIITQKNRTVLLLENDLLKAEIFPHDGGRIVSLIDKSSGREFIWTNPRTNNLTRTYGANYDNLSAGGIEEAFPTGYPDNYNGDELPFFGEIWTVGWDFSPSETSNGSTIFLPVNIQVCPDSLLQS